MFQKRRSMLGRRHLLARQQEQKRQVQPQNVVTDWRENSDSSSLTTNASWRGRRSAKKKTPTHLDKASKDWKKRLFNQSPGPGILYSNINNTLNETGISSIPATPSSSSSLEKPTPMTAQQKRADMEMSRYGPLPSTSRFKSEPLDQLHKLSSSNTYQKQTFVSYDFDNLQQPDSPGPLRLDRLILEEKLEQPVDPDDLKKTTNLSPQNLQTCVQFSPSLSSTCIGTPDSEKKKDILKEEIKESVQCSARKLSIIQEDLSVIEFEHIEQTIIELNETMKDFTINDTEKPSKAPCLENILEDHNSNHSEEFEVSWENISSRLDNMERAVFIRAKKTGNKVKILKQQLENLQKQLEDESQKDISNIKTMRKALNALKNMRAEAYSEDKENNSTFFSICKKNQLDDEREWYNSMKVENPGLLKTPSLNRKIKRQTTWTPHSLSKVLHDQMSQLHNK